MTQEEKIVKLSKQLYDVAKYSPDLRKCIDRALTEIIGYDNIAKICALSGCTKEILIDYYEKIIKENK